MANNPGLDFIANFQGDDTAEEWAKTIAPKIQAYSTGRALVRASQEHSDKVINDIHAAKTNLVNMVRRAPHTGPLALDIVQPSIDAIGKQEGIDPAHSQAIADQMKNDIAHATIQGWAARDPKTAVATMNSAPFSDLLSDGEKASLNTFIYHMGAAKIVDNRAENIQNQKTIQQADFTRGSQYLSALQGQNGDVQFPRNWNTSLFGDLGMTTQTKGALQRAYINLQSGNPTSDPNAVADLISRASSDTPPTHQEVMSRVGDDLSLEHGSFINSMLGPQTPEAQSYISTLSNHIQDAKDKITQAGPGSDAAFGRFMNWMLPTYQADPAAAQDAIDNGKVGTFAPTPDDAVKATVPPPAEKQPLGSIFAGQSMDYFRKLVGPGQYITGDEGVGRAAAYTDNGAQLRRSDFGATSAPGDKLDNTENFANETPSV